MLKRPNVGFSLFAFVLVAFLSTTFVSAPEADARQRGVERIDVEFSELRVSSSRDRIIVDYTIDRGDWRRLQRADITPTLDLYLPRGASHRYHHQGSHRLSSRSGTIVFQNARLHHHQDRVEIALSGATRRARIDSVSYNRRSGDTLRVAVDQPSARSSSTVTRQTTTTRTTTRERSSGSSGSINVRIEF